jgi:hypothetical protein
MQMTRINRFAWIGRLRHSDSVMIAMLGVGAVEYNQIG